MAWAEEIGAHLTDEQGELLVRYAGLVCSENRNIRLTGPLTIDEILRKHVCDSLTAAPLIPQKEGLRLIDIGSGGGFPGMVLKIAKPFISTTLMDSSRKKSGFLETAARSLSIQNITVINDRAERAAKNFSCRENFDVVVCRAVSHLSVITEYALPLMKPGGDFIAYKGRGAAEEVSESKNAIDLLGGELTGIKKLALPCGNEHRALILIRKIAETPLKYPRREGIPRKRPLRG